jgi:23S rRNA (adenine2503-C2)-methyltransferase
MKDIRTLSIDELTSVITGWGEKAFRARQVYAWLWNKNAGHFNEMTNLSLQLREKLMQHFEINPATIERKTVSIDKTMKVLFRLYDGLFVEGVLIPAAHRSTACISVQVGCNLKCRFCATGLMKCMRNLEYAEIIDQVVLLGKLSEEEYNRPLSNIVIMGMGEPLLNYSNTLKAVDIMIAADGLAFSPRRITMSTAGLVEGIRKLADDKIRFNLAISLHAATDKARNIIMPVNKSNPLSELANALCFFNKKTGTRVTFEYLMLADFNDSIEDASSLAAFCRAVPCKINLIEYNPVKGIPFKASPVEKVKRFKEFLESRNMIVTVRHSRGRDIDAACGQLVNKQ